MPGYLRRFPIRMLIPTILATVLAVAGCFKPVALPTNAIPSDGYFFCFWNLENFFDDKEDGRPGEPDKEYDAWFAHNPPILQEKLDHLSKALISMNGGRGPDIFAGVEVESERAAELLCDAMNKRLADPALHYKHVLMKEVSLGRHIAPAIITRLPVQGDKTHLLGKQMRILESHIDVNGHDLVVIASHWTSRLTDKTGDHRSKYADQIYGHIRGMHKGNPNVDVLVCGDFNDTPQDDSVVKHLHATGDAEAVRSSGDDLLLLHLLANRDPNHFGSHYYHKWFIFDHIVVSPGMLDNQGWSCNPDSVEVVRSLTDPHDPQHRPWRFGGPREKAERGYSDHFPVTVRLKVN